MCKSNIEMSFVKDVGISSDKHALIVPPFMGRGNRVHPMSIPDSSPLCKFSGVDHL